MMITEDKITEIFCQEETGVSPGSETVGLGSDDDHDTVSLQWLQVPKTLLYAVCLSAYGASVPNPCIVQQVHGVGEESSRAVGPVPEEVSDGRLYRDKFR